MYSDEQIRSVMHQRARVAVQATKIRDIFEVVADEPWAADATYAAIPGTEDFQVSGFFGVIRAEFGFGRATVDGVVRYVGQYDFRVLGRNDVSTPVFSMVFTGTGYLVGIDRVPVLSDIDAERYPAAKRLFIGEMLQKWMDALPTFG